MVNKRQHTGCGPVGKTALVGAKDRDSNQGSARVIGKANRKRLNSFVDAHAESDAMLYTDGATVYKVRKQQYQVFYHNIGEYARGNGSHQWG